MQIKKTSLFVVAILIHLLACISKQSSKQSAPSPQKFVQSSENQTADPFLWLEEVEGPKALAFVENHNEATLKRLHSLPYYAKMEEDAKAILRAEDKLATPSFIGDAVYNFWQDKDHVRGIWRRSTLASYKKSSPVWEIVLDVDALAQSEKEDWVFKGADCLAPQETRCLISLSRGGKDAVVTREFDTAKKSFVEEGFVLPEAKMYVAWHDADHIFVATDFGDNSMTDSGYPRIVKVWTRGRDLATATTLFEGEKSDMLAEASSVIRPEGSYTILRRVIDFYTSECWLLSPLADSPDQFTKILIPLPKTARIDGVFHGKVIALLRAPLDIDGKTYAPGTLVSVSFFTDTPKIEVVLEAAKNRVVQNVAFGKDSIFVTVLDNVKGRIIRLRYTQKGFKQDELQLPKSGVIDVVTSDIFRDRLILSYQDFLTPSSLYLVESSKTPQIIKKSKARFQANNLGISQEWATSKDGTKIPYFLIAPKDLKRDGTKATLLYGYGGFEISETPFYLSTLGKLWLEAGGAIAFANIRGGGEFGPTWHEAATKAGKQRSFDDFIAVAQKLIADKVSSPQHLGIMGGSNGGLLMGATMTQAPELFKAVVIQVPLLDMLRYHKLLAGASWMAEYGNPDIPEEAAYISRYSPYQVLRHGVKYPIVMFTTSTKDDRVHPGHARKMAAKMESFGLPFEYFENTRGGHAASADLDERAKRTALEWSFLRRELF